jgi:hypothetical protein
MTQTPPRPRVLVSPGIEIIVLAEGVNTTTSGLLQPLSTCPKTPHVAVVLLVHGAPAVASYTDDDSGEWNLWLGGRPTGATIPEKGITGWFPIEIPA